jgi:hypothetical protein
MSNHADITSALAARKAAMRTLLEAAQSMHSVTPTTDDMRAVINVLTAHRHYDLARRLKACWQSGPAVVDMLLQLVRKLQADHEREELSPSVSVADLEGAWALLGEVAGVEA